MVKKVWVRADQDAAWASRKKLVTTALECGADGVLVKGDECEKVRELGRISVMADNGNPDIKLVSDSGSLKKTKGKKAFYKEIRGKEDETEIVNAGRISDIVIINARDWKVIPLENIIAHLHGKCMIFVEVSTADDAAIALHTLEIGADGVLINAGAPEILQIRREVDKISTAKIGLVAIKIKDIKPVGMGDRVCIDAASMFNLGEGMLIGSQANGMFLVHSETIENPYVAARPFRVNAGAVHAYVLMPDGKTKYLCELGSGEPVLAVDCHGNTRTIIVGRAKIERRPLLLIEGEHGGKKIKTLVQNAETIRLVGKDGSAISVVKLKQGDEILGYVENKGRHFGISVAESIEEK